MNFKKLVAATAAIALGAGAVALASATGANAAVLGSVTFSPSTGNQNTVITIQTSGPCDNGDSTYVKVSGTGIQTASERIVGITPNSSYGTNGTGGYVIPVGTFQDFINLQSPVPTVGGQYDFTVQCKNGIGATLYGTYTGSIWFTSPTSYTNVNPSGTTTTLAAPAAGVGTRTVALQATVAGASTPTGSVQFKVDGVNNGAPVALNGSGVASYTTTTLPVGLHAFSADYLPTGTFTASSASPQNYTVTDVTSTTLTSSAGATVQPNTNVTLTATISPTGLAGSVQFKDGASNLGSPVTVASDQAQYVFSSATNGSHSFTAVFTPTTANYSGSTSNTVGLSVSSSGATEDIVTNITAQGSLVIAVNGCTYSSGSLNPADGPAVGPKAGATGANDGSNTINPCNDVVLPSPTLNGTGQLLVTSGSLLPVTITDTRVPDAPWSFTGQVDDFKDFGGAHTLPGSGLGWAPSVLGSNVNNTTIVAGPAVLGDVGPINFTTTGGLKSARAFAFTSANPGTAGTSAAPTGSGLGITQVGGGLTLNVPTNAVPGVYVAHLTLTAI